MKITTSSLCGSKFAKFAGMVGLLAFVTFYASGQTSVRPTIGSGPSHDDGSSTIDAVSELPTGIHRTPDQTQRLLVQQTETKNKPTLPVSVVTTPTNEPEQADAEPSVESDETKLTAEEEYMEPAWRPFDKLPRQSRFLKDEDPAEDGSDDAENGESEKFHWKPAIKQSLVIQGFQLGYALVIQDKTRRALKGPFLQDYWESIKATRGWSDGNKFFTNYIAHPMQGGMTGFIFVQNHDRAKKQKFGESKQYWKDRFKAFVWSAAWSTNWEFGPVSQSSVGNVGLYGHQGYVDFVVTPTVGTGWLLTEEALDRYVIRHVESKNRAVKILARMLLNPMRSVANVLRLKEPWYRDRPFGH